MEEINFSSICIKELHNTKNDKENEDKSPDGEEWEDEDSDFNNNYSINKGHEYITTEEGDDSNNNSINNTHHLQTRTLEKKSSFPS